MPANEGSTVACIAAATEPTAPSVTDNCGNALTPSAAVVGGTYDGCEGTRTYTFTYTDCEGNTHDWVYTYTIEHPTLTFSGTINDVENVNACYSDTHKSQLLTAEEVKAMYTSSCSREITVEISDNVESDNDCNWKITRTYNISDGGCNTDSKTMSVSGRDTIAPYIMPTVLDRTLTSTNCVFTIPDMREEVREISSDGCTGNSALTVEQPSAGMQVYPQAIARDTNVIIRVTDSCGNYSLKSVKITIPAKVVITATATPASICNGETAQLSTTVANVVGAASYVWEPTTGLNSTTIYNPTTTLTATDAPETVTYTVKVTDANGCTATATTFVTVNPEVVIYALADTVINSGTTVPAKFFTTPLTGGVMTYSWTRTNADVVTGMDATGTGNVPGATLYNNTNTAKTTTITVTPTFTANGISCVGATVSYTITVNPTVVMEEVENQVICHGSEIEPITFGTTITDATSFVYNWVRTNTANVTGLTETGSGNIDATALYNETDQVQVTTFTVTPTYTNNGISSTGTPITFDVTVYPEVVMNTVAAQTICHNTAITPITFGTSITDGTMSYAWTRTNTENITPWAGSGNGNIGAEVLSNTTGTYQITEVSVTPTYTNNGKSCVGAVQNFTITVNPEVVMNTPANISVCHGASIEDIIFSSSLTGGTMSYAWTSSNSSVGGVASSGTGDIPSTVLTNTTTTAQTTTITVTPTYTANDISCVGAQITFTITVNPKVVMNDVADQAICHGSAIAAVNFSSDLTGGDITYTWRRTNSNVVGLAMSGTGNIAAATLTNTTTTAQVDTIYVKPTYEANSNVCDDDSVYFTITVNPKVGMETPDNQSICHGSEMAAVTFSSDLTGGDITYTWRRTNSNVVGLDMSGTGNIPTTILTNTTNRVQVDTIYVKPTYEANSNVCDDDSVFFTITVNPEVRMDTPDNQAICHGTDINSVVFTTPITDGTVVYNWTRTNDNIGGVASSGTGDIPSTVLTNTTTTAQTTTITVTPTYTANDISCVGAQITFTITVYPEVVMNDVEDQAICHGSAIEAVNFSSDLTGGDITYTWRRTNSNVVGLAMSGAGNIAATTLTNTTTTAQVDTIYVKPTYEANSNVCDDDSVYFTITVNPKVVMDTVANQAICHGSAITAVNFTTPITDGSVVYSWSRDNNNIGGLAMSGIGNIAAATLTNTTNTAQTTTITVTPVYANNGKTCTDETITFTITVYPKVVMDTVADQAICHGSTITAVNFSSDLSGGDITYTWRRTNSNIGGLDMSDTGNIPATVLTNTTNTVQVDTITVTPVYTNNGNECTDETITFTITVNPKVVMNDVADQAICHGSAITAVNFSSDLTGGDITYTWRRTNSNVVGLAMSGIGNIPATVLTNTTNTAQVDTIYVKPTYVANSNVCDDDSVFFTITVNPKVVMDTVADQAICHGSEMAAVNFTTPITDGSVVYNWTRTNSHISGLDMSGAGNIPATVLTNTTNTAQVDTITVTLVYTNNGKTCTDETITFTITVNPKVVMNDVLDQAICHGSAITAVNFTTPITDGSVVYNWSRDNDSISGLAMSGTGNIPATVLTNTTNTAQVDTITVTPVYTNNEKTCTDESITFTITVNPKVVMNDVDDQAICHNSTIEAVNFTTPITDGSVVYNWRRDNDSISGLAMSGTGNIAAATLTNTTNTAQTTTITVTPVYTNNEKTCTDESITFTITVNPEVVMNTVEDWTLCVGETSPEYVYTSTITDGTVTYGWSNDNTAIGLAASGTGNLPSFVAANSTSADLIAEVKVAPTYANNGISCQGDSINFHITVRPSITTPGNVAFTCPADTTVVLSYSECEQFVNIGYPEFVNNMTGMTVNITNDAPEGNIFPEGTTIVTWTATDECGAFLTCTQNVVVQFPSCGDSIADFDGYRYSSVRIGCQCWTGENARSEHYSDGTPVDNFRYYNDSDSLENIYGKLYTWYTAVRVPEGDDTAVPADSIDPLGNSYVQGICPEGWALPTVDEYMLMIANSGDATHAKDGSNLYWLPGYEGQPPFSGFDAYGAGKYNGAIDRYQDLLGKTYFWTTLSGSGSETATTVEINYYCAEGLQTELSKGDGVSIRCIRKR